MESHQSKSPLFPNPAPTAPPSNGQVPVSSSLLFPQYCPHDDELRQDDRFISLINVIHSVLLQRQQSQSSNCNIEIEAKIGQIIPQEKNYWLGRYLLQQPHWSYFLPFKDPKEIKQAYRFEPQIFPASQQVQRTIYADLLGVLQRQAQKGVNGFQEMPFKKQKDIVFKSGSRATYLYQKQNDQWVLNQEPSEIIKKEKVDEINIKKGSSEQLICSDVRVSTQLEHKLSSRDIEKASQQVVREKERHSFLFKWMSIDLTVTNQANRNEQRQPNMSYEIEIEIHDIKHILSHLQRRDEFNMLMLRFFQNVISFTRLIKQIGQDASRVHQPPIPVLMTSGQNNDQELLMKEKEKQQQAYEQFFGTKVKGIVGDYLGQVALRNLNQ